MFPSLSLREVGAESPDGLVSNYLHDHVSEGNVLEISAPAGGFTLDLKKRSPVVLISGGIGLTPMMSMLKTVTEIQPERDVTFVHGAKNSLVHAFQGEVEALANDKVKFFVFYTSPTQEAHANKSHDVEGHISAEWLEQNVDLQSSDFYFCGPVPFMKKINRYLKDLGVSDDRIHFEFFGPMGNLEA